MEIIAWIFVSLLVTGVVLVSAAILGDGDIIEGLVSLFAMAVVGAVIGGGIWGIMYLNGEAGPLW